MPVYSDPISPKIITTIRFWLCFFLVIIVCGAFFDQEVQAAARAEIKDIVVNNSSEDLLLYLIVDRAFQSDTGSYVSRTPSFSARVCEPDEWSQGL